MIVCGPCGADNFDASIEYCQRLYQLSLKVKDKIFLMPRLYTAKARSNGEGYLGMLFQPDSEVIDINKGLMLSRKMLAKCIAVTGLPIAEEFLFLEQLEYNADLISYFFLGARQSDSPFYRNVVSGVDVAVGIKNDLAGNMLNLAGSVHASSTPKTFLFKGGQITTTGNRFCHGVLRGFVDESTGFYNNISQQNIDALNNYCLEFGTQNDFVMVDCSHANSKKCALNQIDNALKTVSETSARGIMLESYLFGGTAADVYGVSKTDECLDWENTEKLILKIYDYLSQTKEEKTENNNDTDKQKIK